MVQSGNSGNGAQMTFCFLSDLLGKKVYGGDGKLLGKVNDLVASFSDRYPEVDGVVIRKKQKRTYIPIGAEDMINLAQSKSMESKASPHFDFKLSAHQFFVKDTLYDKQIVDVNGAKVERVNDVHFLIYSGKPFLVHVDVGFSGLSRRLGFENSFRSIAKLFGKPFKDELISWKFVQPLPEGITAPVQVMLNQEQFRQLHAGELADIIEELDRDERIALVKTIGAEDAAEALEEADIGVQTSIIRDLDSELAADILEEMEPAAAADVMDKLPAEAQQSIMEAMEDEERAQIELLAQAEENSAASIMTVEYISCRQNQTVEEALTLIKRNADEVESIAYVYCLDDKERLCGVVSIRDLILADSTTPIHSIMHKRLAMLHSQDDWETVADNFMKFRFQALPVVDPDGRMHGIVTFKHSFDELLPYYYKMAS